MTNPYVEQLKTLRDPAPPKFAALETPRGLTFVRCTIVVVLAFGLLGCVTKGANNPADPFLAAPTSSSSSGQFGLPSTTNAIGRAPLTGFGETQISVQTPDQLLTWCLLLAATEDQRQRGLMQAIDPALGGYDGMLFRYEGDVQEQYWMRNTPMALSIAWFSSDGQLVATSDMEPCGDSPDCPNYPLSGPPPAYRYAIEVPLGRLPALGLDAGSTMTDQQTPCS